MWLLYHIHLQVLRKGKLLEEKTFHHPPTPITHIKTSHHISTTRYTAHFPTPCTLNPPPPLQIPPWNPPPPPQHHPTLNAQECSMHNLTSVLMNPLRNHPHQSRDTYHQPHLHPAPVSTRELSPDRHHHHHYHPIFRLSDDPPSLPFTAVPLCRCPAVPPY